MSIRHKIYITGEIIMSQKNEKTKQLFTGLKGKLITYLLLLTLIPFGILIITTVFSSRNTLIGENTKKLESILNNRGKQIESYFTRIMYDSLILGKSTDVFAEMEEKVWH